MQTMVVYATRFGATRWSAEVLVENMGGEGTVLLREANHVNSQELMASDRVIIGSSIVAGRWKGSAKRLLKRAVRAHKPVAIFVTAGGTIQGLAPGSPPDAQPTTSLAEREAKAVAQYIQPLAGKLGCQPVATAAFGGRMVMFGKEIFDNWEGARVASWAKELVKLAW